VHLYENTWQSLWKVEQKLESFHRRIYQVCQFFRVTISGEESKENIDDKNRPN
jgi:hypothetical protein